MRVRDQRGVVLPSPLVMLSVIAVAMAAIAFVATAEPTKEPKPTKAPEPAVERGKVYVEVYNNSAVTGLAGRVAQKAGNVGWQVVGADNWYGTIPTSTVYYPKKLERAAKLLALDLGIERTAPAVEPMRMDRLTLILTGELG